MKTQNVTVTAESLKSKRMKNKKRKRKFKGNFNNGSEENPRPAEEEISEISTRKRKRRRKSAGENRSSAKLEHNFMESSKYVEKQSQNAMTREPSKPPMSSLKPNNFLDKMRARLAGGHFRMLNEKLYTCRGSEAYDLFKNDPSLFNVYHSGYQEQMSHWPQQPVDVITKWLKEHSHSLVVADFGCGDARLAKCVKNKVFSIDLVSSDPSVIACDMAHTPLTESSVDVAVFCLSLMGTDFPDYLKEAYRVLKPGGWLLVAEVKSRFDPDNGGADPNKFVKALNCLGFNIVFKDFSSKIFVLFYFRKEKGRNIEGKQIDWPRLKPCIYKRR
ncbi:ribosomal RNA-processing protein 8 isoform X2 [Cryptomeria japonica]|uniref:ribosomal RNA-processing protein 8 isoform X2 n=1 Tax=Cryptomeria japonica TaxID=3369 RepID=UPI0027DA9CDC|nr:ribosomal RNA-processing protein 8 isoform X2 [Cryptomeria japonica]